MSAMDQALTMLAGAGPEFGTRGLSNHGPMAAEALGALGRDDAVEGWVAGYRTRLSERPSHIERINAESWREALGDVRRVSDWEDFFAIELDSMAWPDVLERWVPRLAPGVMSGATHGLIRTAHATRSLSAEASAGRRAELAACPSNRSCSREDGEIVVIRREVGLVAVCGGPAGVFDRTWAPFCGSITGDGGPPQAAPQAFCSLSKLWTVQAIVHSDSTAVSPRRKNWRKPRASLIWPKTGSTVCFLSL